MTITCTIPYLPLPKQGDRTRIAGNGKRQWVQHYQPKAVVQDAANLAAMLAPYRPDEPMQGPLMLWAQYTWPWLKRHSKKHRAAGRIPKDTKPDAENLSKQLCDVLERSGWFANDSQIASLTIERFWGDDAGLRLQVGEMADDIYAI